MTVRELFSKKISMRDVDYIAIVSDDGIVLNSADQQPVWFGMHQLSEEFMDKEVAAFYVTECDDVFSEWESGPLKNHTFDDSSMFSYEMESGVEYCEMVDFIKSSANAKEKSRALSYRILTDKVFRHQPMTVIADRYHLKKSAAYRRLNEARGDFYNSYLMNGEQALSA